jgi:leucyl aminopeptidase
MDTLSHHIIKKPGADDDASGVAVSLETARVLLNSHYKFKRPIYFVWYAGSEEGKLGAQSIVRYFNHKQIKVDAVLHLDMTGYTDKDNVGIGLTDDATDAALNTFVSDLITTYVKKPVGAVRCGFACSDHVLWYRNGNRVVYPFETLDDQGNPYVHSSDDVIKRLSIGHMEDFVKLSVAFAVELAEPM